MQKCGEAMMVDEKYKRKQKKIAGRAGSVNVAAWEFN